MSSTIYDRLTAFNKNRLPDMLKLKYKAMSLNVFSFFRGTCHIFYEDLAAAKPLPSSPLAWICGDLHLENFGSFKGDNRQEYFDLNDFDEAILAPSAWETVRLVTSIFVEFENLGVEKDEALKTSAMFLDTYSAALKNGKAVGIDPRTADGIVHEFLKAVEKRKQKELLKKRTTIKKGKLVFLQDADRHFEIEKTLKKELTAFIESEIKNIKCITYNYVVIDSIFRLAGTGSIGVKRYMFLLKNLDVEKKYLLLDMKQAVPSSLKPYVKIQQPEWPTEAERVVAIQHCMQNVNPAFFTPVVFKDEPYTIKQLQPTDDKINFELIKGRVDDIHRVISDMARLTASAQLRSSGRRGAAIADELIAYGENNQWHDDILKYASQYTAQVKKDYDEFIAGYKKGLYQQ
jgi:uncharacterized protein (DUF2252 family)